MLLGEQLDQQVIAKFRHGYVRHEALLARLALQQPAISNGERGCPALQHFIAQCSSDSGQGCAPHQNGKHQPGSTGDPFLASLTSEVDRVRLFFSSHLEELWVQLLEHIRQLQTISAVGVTGGGSHSQQSATDVLQSMEASLDAFGEELCLIEHFGRQNVMTCALLAQMSDQQGCAAPGEGVQVEGGYLACMEHLMLGEARLDPLLVGLSDAYELLRNLQSHALGSRAKWVPPEQFQRLTRKFWLQPADVTRFKCQVIRHLPVLIFGERRKLTEGGASCLPFLAEQQGVRDSGPISSVYYDNPETLNTYHTRLRKEDYATAVRVRWYGERSLRGEQQLFVERKLHRDSWSGMFSSKDRAPMQQQFLPGYTAGVGAPPGIEGGSTQAVFLREVQDYLTENQQVPLLRTVYRRTAFQKSSDNIVRISMDTDLHMIKELGAPRVPGDWCRDMSSLLGHDEVVGFPYAVVEIKLQAKPPQWIKDLVQSGILLPLPRFSKFLHGVGMLYQHMTEQMPNWFLPDEADPTLLTPATWEEMADTSDEFLKSAASWLFPASFDPPPKGGSPLAALRRNKTAPAAAAAPGTSRGAAAANARHFTAFELACEGLPEAQSGSEDAGSEEGSRRGSRGQEPGLERAGESVAPHPSSLSGANAPALASAAGAGAGALAAPSLLPRMQTWPVYQHTVGAGGTLQNGAATGSFLPASYAALGFVGAGAQQEEPATRSVHAVSEPLWQQEPQRVSGQNGESIKGTSEDSAKDIESGKVSEVDSSKVQPQLGLQQRAPLTSAFASQLYKQMGGGAAPAGCQPGSGGSQPPKKGPSRAAALVRTRVEPKTFFANERTFLSWLQISVLVMMIAFGLLSGTFVSTANISTTSNGGTGCPTGDNSCKASKISGAIIAPVALLFMAYSLFMYKKRTIQILRRETVRYDDQRGPVLLVAILLVVMITAYVISLIWIF